MVRRVFENENKHFEEGGSREGERRGGKELREIYSHGMVFSVLTVITIMIMIMIKQSALLIFQKIKICIFFFCCVLCFVLFSRGHCCHGFS
jgi:ABC-type transport system involved in Fe-S cluster assembly fused permease/ATPase subunit